MNLGLILAKPGESDLGLSYRLWMANLQSWYLNDNSIGDLIEDEIRNLSYLAKIEPNFRGLERIRAIEKKHLPNIFRPNIPPTLKTVKKTRNCHLCALNGYHSLYFDLPWIDECPVHKKKLTNCCSKCGQFWPSPMEVHLRTCKLCGVRQKPKLNKFQPNLIIKGFENSIYQPIMELDIFFNKSLNFAQPVWRHDSNIISSRSSDCSKTILYPSILAAHSYKDYLEWQQTLPIKNILQHCVRKSFKRDTKSRKYWGFYIDDKTREKLSNIRQKVLKQADQKLQDLAGHEMDSCFEPSNTLDDGACYYCKVRKLLKSAFYRYAHYRGKLANYEYRQLGKNIFDDPGLIFYLNDFGNSENYGDVTNLAVPRSIQFHLYELDVISCVKQLAYHVKIGSGNNHHRNYSHLINQLESTHGFSNHYFFVVESGEVVLYYPEEYKDFSFENFDNWLAISSRF